VDVLHTVVAVVVETQLLKELDQLLKKCWLLDNKLRQKLLEIRTNIMMEQMNTTMDYQEEKGRGR